MAQLPNQARAQRHATPATDPRLKELVDEIDPRLFWQIHRSTLVNVKAIAGVVRDFRGRQIVSVKGHPEKLEVSRSYTGLFKGM